MDNTTFDLVVLGAGPGGYVGAIRAAQLGLSVCIIEKDKLGGVCLNVGCIPSKALIHGASVFQNSNELEKFGITVDKSKFDYKAVFDHSRTVADNMSKGVQFLLKKNNITVISGKGTIVSPHDIVLEDNTKITGKNILIATGSVPRIIPGFEFDGTTILSSTDALMLNKLPKSMFILGGGAIGCEFAHILSSFGVNVTIVEMMNHLLPQEDSETANILERMFRRRKITVYTNTKATKLTKTEDGAEIIISDKDGKESKINAEKVLVVVGRSTSTTNIGLENIGIKTERGFIPTFDYYETSVKGVYACGDVVISPQLAHVASKEAEIAVEHIAGKQTKTRIDPNEIPGGVYTEPQVGSFGLNEDKAKLGNIPFAKAVFQYRALGKAAANKTIDGHIKIVYSPETKEILGASIIGADATELIHEILLAKTMKAKLSDIAEMIHSHPTLSEGIMEAAKIGLDGAIHA